MIDGDYMYGHYSVSKGGLVSFILLFGYSKFVFVYTIFFVYTILCLYGSTLHEENAISLSMFEPFGFISTPPAETNVQNNILGC